MTSDVLMTELTVSVTWNVVMDGLSESLERWDACLAGYWHVFVHFWCQDDLCPLRKRRRGTACHEDVPLFEPESGHSKWWNKKTRDQKEGWECCHGWKHSWKEMLTGRMSWHHEQCFYKTCECMPETIVWLLWRKDKIIWGKEKNVSIIDKENWKCRNMRDVKEGRKVSMCKVPCVCVYNVGICFSFSDVHR